MRWVTFVLLAGCGRVGFDALGDARGPSDGAVSIDAPADGAAATCTQPPCFEEVLPTVSVLPVSVWGNYLAMGSVLYFAGDDGVNGVELWRTDGTGAGTRMVKDINPAGDSQPMMMMDYGGALVFFASDGTHGRELWTSDGTDAGTHMLADINPGPGDGAPVLTYKPVVLGSKMLFAGTDGVNGTELWAYDGVAAAMLADLEPGAGSGNPYEIWPLDPTHAIFRARTTTYGAELYITDGVTVSLIADAAPGAADSLPDGWFHYFGVLGGYAYYRGTDGVNGLELWRTDGKAANTKMVKDIQQGPGDGLHGAPWTTPIGSKILFHAVDAVNGNEPFITDGSTTIGLDLNPTGDSIPLDDDYEFTPWNGRTYFRATDGTHGYELWSTDQTPSGTRQEAEINPTGSSAPGSFFIVGNTLYFSASDGTNGQQLWTFDGTTPSLVHAFGMTDANPFELAQLGTTVVLGVDDAMGVTHLWRMF